MLVDDGTCVITPGSLTHHRLAAIGFSRLCVSAHDPNRKGKRITSDRNKRDGPDRRVMLFGTSAVLLTRQLDRFRSASIDRFCGGRPGGRRSGSRGQFGIITR